MGAFFVNSKEQIAFSILRLILVYHSLFRRPRNTYKPTEIDLGSPVLTNLWKIDPDMLDACQDSKRFSLLVDCEACSINMLMLF
uniref:Ovule protein n=1 Tax=Ascaris lumbricoides TaxID=6252 RepID=A0A0M3HLQ0_ASCLU